MQEKTVIRLGSSTPIDTNVRIIAATNKPLENLIETRGFREDLFYRLNVFPIELPPLRDRPKDIVNLTKHFVSDFSEDGEIQINDEVFDVLKSYPFPGNVRELRNLAERLTLLCKDNKIDKSIIPYEIKFPGLKPSSFIGRTTALTEERCRT